MCLFFHDPHLVPSEHQSHRPVVSHSEELISVDLIVGDPVITQHLVQVGRFRHPFLTVRKPAEFPEQIKNDLNKIYSILFFYYIIVLTIFYGTKVCCSNIF